MTNLDSDYTDTEWIEEVYQLLREIVAVSVSPQHLPKMPDLVKNALSLANKAKTIQQKADGRIIPLESLEWVGDVRQFLLDLFRDSLGADAPRLSVNFGQRARGLLKQAKDIKEKVAEKKS